MQEHDGFTKISEDAFLKYFANGVEPTTTRKCFTPCSEPTAASHLRRPHHRGRLALQAELVRGVEAATSTINPDLERFLAKRMNATTVELDAGHLSLVSQPDRRSPT